MIDARPYGGTCPSACPTSASPYEISRNDKRTFARLDFFTRPFLRLFLPLSLSLLVDLDLLRRRDLSTPRIRCGHPYSQADKVSLDVLRNRSREGEGRGELVDGEALLGGDVAEVGEDCSDHGVHRSFC